MRLQEHETVQFVEMGFEHAFAPAREIMDKKQFGPMLYEA